MVTITLNASLKEYNTFGLSAKAAVLAEYDNVEALKLVLGNELVQQHKDNIWCLGKEATSFFRRFQWRDSTRKNQRHRVY